MSRTGTRRLTRGLTIVTAIACATAMLAVPAAALGEGGDRTRALALKRVDSPVFRALKRKVDSSTSTACRRGAASAAATTCWSSTATPSARSA